MDVTSQLLKVYQVEKQLRSLKSRLNGAEKFLAGQDKELATLDTQRAGLEGQIKQLTAQAMNQEGESKALEEKMAKIRGQMDNSQSNKEYKAFLTELNTYKIDKERYEGQALELMTKVDDLKKQHTDLISKREERTKVRGVASSDRDARHGEVAGRVKELETERAGLVKDVPADVMRDFQRLLDQRGDEAMGAIEIADAKRHEFHCGVCMMAVPVDTVVGLIKNTTGKITKCSSCQCLLFIEPETVKALQPASSKK
jgi:uncharacterized protein